MVNKIIFLDIDGVVNVLSEGMDEFGFIFDPELVENLAYIVQQTGAQICLSSSWRKSGSTIMREMWEKRNLPGEYIGRTPTDDELVRWGVYPEDYDILRGHEIQYWLDNYSPHGIPNYVILDDDTDMLESQLTKFVCTDHGDPNKGVYGYGLTRELAEKAIEILNNV